MANFLLDAHNYFRWVILLLAIIGAARSVVALISRDAKFARLDVGLSVGYGLLLIVQGLAGALLVMVDLLAGRSVAWPHLLIMLTAIVAGNLHWRFRLRPDRVRHQVQLAIFIGTITLLSLGLAAIQLLPFTDQMLNVVTISLAIIGLLGIALLIPLYLARDASRRGHRTWAILIVIFSLFLFGWLVSLAYLASVDRRSPIPSL